MFVREADKTCLRQGDILEGVLFPRFSSGEITVLGRISPENPQPLNPKLFAFTSVHRDDPNWLTSQIPARLSYGAVVSQCCDLEPRHDKLQLPAFAIARLIPIPKAISEDPQRMASLRSNKDPRDPSDPGYLNLFFIPAHEYLGNVAWVVDYNQVVSIPGREFPGILSKKILQMHDEWRVKFKIKLAACFARLTEEEQKTGLENPWAWKQRNTLFPE